MITHFCFRWEAPKSSEDFRRLLSSNSNIFLQASSFCSLGISYAHVLKPVITAFVLPPICAFSNFQKLYGANSISLAIGNSSCLQESNNFSLLDFGSCTNHRYYITRLLIKWMSKAIGRDFVTNTGIHESL